MRIFQTKWFARFTRKEGISDARLCQAVRDAEAGHIDADYGGGVIKQRVARPNEGKSGGYRSIVLFRKGRRAFFVYGFAKNARGNIDESDERDFKILAKVLLIASDTDLERLVDEGKYVEVHCDDQN